MQTHTRRRTLLRRARNPLIVEQLEDRTVPSTYWVNTTADTVDSNPNVTSLREAVEAANDTPGVPDVIRFAPQAWGTITLTFTDCNNGQVSWQPTAAGYTSGSMPIARLTIPAGLSCP